MTPYQKKVAEEALGDAAKLRIRRNLQKKLKGEASAFPTWMMRGLATVLAVILVCAVAIPTVFALYERNKLPDVGGVFEEPPKDTTPSEKPNPDTSSTPPADNTPADDPPADNPPSENPPVSPADPPEAEDPPPAGEPYNPDGLNIYFGKDYSDHYERGERITLTLYMMTGHDFEASYEENGFTVCSFELISAEPNDRGYFTDTSVPWTTYTYSVELEVSSTAQKISCTFTFTLDNGFSMYSSFYGYQAEGKVFVDHVGDSYAYKHYLDYLLANGRITQEERDQMMQDYWFGGWREY